jgi:hypothetical protein
MLDWTRHRFKLPIRPIHLERSIPSTASAGSETNFSSPLSSKGEKYVAIPFLDSSSVFRMQIMDRVSNKRQSGLI